MIPPIVDNPNCTGTVQLYAYEDIPATVTTHRLHLMQEVRNNLRAKQIERDGVLRPTPLLDAAIERLEDLLAMHLPAGSGGLL